jgi:superfamily II DNA or RNA helicase
MRALPYVIDNDRHRLADVLNQVLADHRDLALDVATAYFNVRGYGLVAERLKTVGSLRLLLGDEPTEAAQLGLRPRTGSLVDVLRGMLNQEPFAPGTLTLVEDLIRFLREERVRVRVYEHGFLHAKCYLFYGNPHHAPLFDRFRPVLGIVGSSNFTGPGLSTNRELNLVHKGILPEDEVDDERARKAALSHFGEEADDAADPYGAGLAPQVSRQISFESKRVLKSEVGAVAIWDLADWYERQWERSRDFKQELIDLLDASKFGAKEYTPYEVYLKALFEYFRADLEAAGVVPADLYALNLAEFQADAVARAQRILEKYDGVMICDSVGLGKTWIGLQLLLDYAYHRRHDALIICPASLRAMWDTRLHQTKIQATLLGQEVLGRAEFDPEPYGKFDLVLVDESHNFRNRSSGRSDNLARLIGLNGGRGEHGYRKKLVLMTATPINNSVMDLHNQLRFLTRGDNAFFAGAGIGRLDRYFLSARRALLNGQASAGRALGNVLEEVVIRRTRQYIRKVYPEATIDGKKVHFPERKLLTVRYNLEGTYAGIYAKVVRDIEQLKLAPYDLEAYKADPAAQDSKQVQRGQALVGIFKSRYLKRLESSVAAFRISLFRLMEYLLTFRHYLLEGVLLEPGDFWKLLGTIERDLEDDARAEEELEEAEDDTVLGRRPQSRHGDIKANTRASTLLKKAPRLPETAYDLQGISDALDADLSALESCFDLVRPIKPDADLKLQRVRAILAEELAGRKVLLFTSYKDTADYLGRHIGRDAAYLAQLGGRRVRVIHGGMAPEARVDVVRAFAPKSNERPEWAGTEKEIDILVSTDVLSEGQNLQDSAHLLNYDLHWNPTRMIQRAGRIDRIGTAFDTLYIHNFFPDAGLERLLGLVQSLQSKIRQIDETVGLDASVLGEAINPKVFNTLKRIEGEDATVIDEEEAEAELASDEGLVRHLTEFVRAHGKDVLKTLPDGIHSGLCRRGYHGVFFYFQYPGPTPAQTDHYWRYYDATTGAVEDNRLALAELIRCGAEEPRVVDPALHADVHGVMALVEDQILAGSRDQESWQAAPPELSADQSAILVTLQQLLERPGVERRRVLATLAALSQPLLNGPIKELKKALAQFHKSGKTEAFLSECEAVSQKYAPAPNPTKVDSGEPRRQLQREDLRLVCFEYLS